MEYAATMFQTLAGLFKDAPGPAMLLVGVLMLAGARIQRFRSKTPAPTTKYLLGHPTVLLWYALSVFLVLAGVLIMVLTPFVAQAGMFSFIGDTAKAVADTSIAGLEYKFKGEVLQAIQASLGTLILLTCIIGAVICMWAAGYVVIRFFESARTAMQDNRITVPERVVLSVQGVTALVAGGMLGYFGLLLLNAVRAGLSELLG